uniref:Zona pellucida sperm-binding protein 4 n=1 Tax=Mola mola TaxID=94237 RepID=A0A3Q3X1G5_MOLML
MGGFPSSHSSLPSLGSPLILKPQDPIQNPQNPSYGRPTQGHSSNPQNPSYGGPTQGHSSNPQNPSYGRPTQGHSSNPQNPSYGGPTQGHSSNPQNPSYGGPTQGHSSNPQNPSYGRPTQGHSSNPQNPSYGGPTQGHSSNPQNPSYGRPTQGHSSNPQNPSYGGPTQGHSSNPQNPSYGRPTQGHSSNPQNPSYGGPTQGHSSNPQNPSYGRPTQGHSPNPQNPSQGGTTPSRYPNVQNPSYPGKPQLPSQNPQNPIYPGKPQLPSQNPQNPIYPGKPQLPSQNPQNPIYPGKPQLPSQNPQAPSHTGYPSLSHTSSHNPSLTGSHTSRYPSNPSVGTHTQRYPNHQGKPQQTGSHPQTKNPRPKRPLLPPQTPKLPSKAPVLPPPKPIYPVKYSPRGYANIQSQQDPQVPQPQQLSESYKPHQATSSHGPSVYPGNLQKQPSFHTCEVEESQRVPCGSIDISAAACDAISCCFDGRNCYFAKAVTVQCTKDAYFIVVVARDSTIPNIDLDSVLLWGDGPGCTHVDSNSDFAIYYFPVTACGTIVLEEPGVIIYENRMSSTFEVGMGELGMTTRDSSYELLFQCRYTGTSVEALVIDFALQDPPLPVAALGPLRVQMKLAKGYCSVKGCDEVEAAYTSFYTDAEFPVPKVLREPVYVEVQLLERTDPFVVLTLGHCWTTASPNPHSLPQWDLLIDGCPYTHDNYMTSLVEIHPSSGVEFPGHHRRFFFKMFSFVDTSVMEPTRQQVYIHCSTSLCHAIPGSNCEPHCFRKMRSKRSTQAPENTPKTVASTGPVVYTAA